MCLASDTLFNAYPFKLKGESELWMKKKKVAIKNDKKFNQVFGQIYDASSLIINIIKKQIRKF